MHCHGSVAGQSEEILASRFTNITLFRRFYSFRLVDGTTCSKSRSRVWRDDISTRFVRVVLLFVRSGVIGKFGRGLSAFSGEGGGRSFVQLAALAGCDYVDNIRGLGLLTALPIITKFRRTPADKRVSHILMHVQKMGKAASDVPLHQFPLIRRLKCTSRDCSRALNGSACGRACLLPRKRD